MNMSEILTRVDSLSDRSLLVTRSVEREETPVLTLVDTRRIHYSEIVNYKYNYSKSV